MKKQFEFRDKMNRLDGRQKLIALNAVLEGKIVKEALEIAEKSPLWEKLENNIDILHEAHYLNPPAKILP